MEIKILPIWSTWLLAIWRRVRKHRGHTGPVLPPNFELLNLPLSAEGVMVGEGGPCVGCGWSFFHVKRYTKGLRSTCLPSPCLLPPVVSESLYKTHTHTHTHTHTQSLYSSGIFWVQRGLRSLIFFHLLVYLSFTKTVYYAVNSCAFCRACELQYLIGPGRKFRQTEKAWCKMTNGNSYSASDSRSTIGQGGEWGQPESPCPHLHSPSPADCCCGECRLCIASIYQVKPEVWHFFHVKFLC